MKNEYEDVINKNSKSIRLGIECGYWEFRKNYKKYLENRINKDMLDWDSFECNKGKNFVDFPEQNEKDGKVIFNNDKIKEYENFIVFNKGDKVSLKLNYMNKQMEFICDKALTRTELINKIIKFYINNDKHMWGHYLDQLYMGNMNVKYSTKDKSWNGFVNCDS